MKIDVLILHNGQNITVKSEAARYNETKPATIGFSKSENEDAELIEGIGEQWTTSELKQLAVKQRGEDNRIYRVINPFSFESFEPGAAYRTVQYYCFKVHEIIRPKTYLFRSFLKLDRFEITLKLPEYNFVSADKRKEFETQLRVISKRIKIKQ